MRWSKIIAATAVTLAVWLVVLIAVRIHERASDKNQMACLQAIQNRLADMESVTITTDTSGVIRVDAIRIDQGKRAEVTRRMQTLVDGWSGAYSPDIEIVVDENHEGSIFISK